MDVNHKGGQEMMNLNNLNDGEIKKMVGEPAQAGGRFDLKSKESVSSTTIPKRKGTSKEGVSDSCFQRFVIPIDNSIKSFWDYAQIIESFAFSPDLSSGLVVFESIVEVCFAIDIALKFFHEYRDIETHEVVHEVRKIARKYIFSWFFFDLIAVIPVALIMRVLGQEESQYAVVIKLLRILRLPKFMRLLDTSKFDSLLDTILEKEPKNPQEEKSRQEKMNIKYISRYAYKVFRLILIALMLTYFLGSLWFFLVSIMPTDDNYNNFIRKYDLDQKENIDKLIICCYFVLTTLSTIGYGDLSPQTNSEKILGISLMIVGIAFFSYIMGNFNDVLINYDKKMGIIDRRNDLQVWMTSLDKFNPNVPIPRSLLTRINNHFNFFWKHDRLSCLTPDDKYLQTMPVPLRIQLINFLFDDIFHQFRAFFFKKKYYNSPFYYEVAFLFLPRQYEKGSTIIKKGEEFHEILLQTDGELKGMLACDPPVNRYYHKGFFLGDYEVIHNKRSMLTYETTGAVKFLALPKHKFLKILEKYPEICEEMKINSVEQHTQQKNRYRQRLGESLKEQKGGVDIKIDQEEVKRLFHNAINIEQDNKVATLAKENSAENRIYSKDKLDKLTDKLEGTDQNIKNFTKSIEDFCSLMNKEMGDITKKLEELKTKLIDQEKK